jgi:hypothetical protein
VPDRLSLNVSLGAAVFRILLLSVLLRVLRVLLRAMLSQ